MERVEVTLTNRYAELLYPFPDDIGDYYSYMVPNHRHMPLFKLGKWDGSKNLMRGSRVPSGLFLATQGSVAKEAGIKWKIRDKREFCRFKPKTTAPKGMTPRPHQLEAVEAMVNAGVGGIILNATGTGKTITAGLMFRRLIGKAVFIVDELTLLDQARTEIAGVLEEEVGIVGESKFRPRRVTVATIQTLLIHAGTELYQAWAAKLDMMVIDEVHVALNPRQREVISAFQPRCVIGLTATLDLKDEAVRLPAFALCGPVLYTYNYTDGVADKHLSQGVVVAANMTRRVQADAKLEGVAAYADSYRRAIVRSRARNTFIEETVREGIRRGYYIAVLVERVPHLKKLSKRLRDIPHEVIYGARDVADRIAAKKKFEAGDIRLLLTNKVFKKGINLKALDLMIDAASMDNENDAVQKFGRGVRLNEGKRGLIYIDLGEGAVRKPGTRRAEPNTFMKATMKRRKALARNGAPIVVVNVEEGAKAVLNAGEKLLVATLGKG